MEHFSYSAHSERTEDCLDSNFTVRMVKAIIVATAVQKFCYLAT